MEASEVAGTVVVGDLAMAMALYGAVSRPVVIQARMTRAVSSILEGIPEVAPSVEDLEDSEASED